MSLVGSCTTVLDAVPASHTQPITYYCAPYVGARFLHPHSINNCHSYLASSVEPCSTTILDAILISHTPSITLYCTPYIGAHFLHSHSICACWLGIVQPLWALSSSLTRHLPSSTSLLLLCRRHQGGESQGCRSPSSNMAVDDWFEQLKYSKWGNKSNEGKMQMRSGNHASKVW